MARCQSRQSNCRFGGGFDEERVKALSDRKQGLLKKDAVSDGEPDSVLSDHAGSSNDTGSNSSGSSQGANVRSRKQQQRVRDEIAMKRKCTALLEKFTSPLSPSEQASVPAITSKDLEFIRSIIRSESLVGKASVFQLVSSLLKLSRSQSHPERSLGTKRKPSCDDGVGIHKQIVDMVLEHHCFQWELLCCCSDDRYVFYFYLCLCGDILKRVFKHEDEKTPMEFSFKLALAKQLIQHAEHCVETDVNCSSVPEHKASPVYWPEFSKCFQVIQQFVEGDVEFRPNLLCSLCSLSVTASPVLHRFLSSEALQTAPGCSLISRSSHAGTFIQLFSFQVTVLNLVLKIESTSLSIGSCCSEPSISPPVSESLRSITKTVELHGIGRVINLLAHDDKNMIHCLLQLAEVQLRLEHIVVGSATSSDVINKELSALKTVCSIERVFTEFVHSAISYDVNVMLDLLCSNETQSLQYLLRVLKKVANNVGTLRDTLTAYRRKEDILVGGPDATISADKVSNPQMDCRLESGARCIVLTGSGWHKDDLVADIEWERDSNSRNSSHSAHNDEEGWDGTVGAPGSSHRLKRTGVDRENSGDDTKESLRTFLDHLNETLQRRQKLSMLPFNPALLRDKLTAIIQGIDSLTT
jgi:hypothetical protein